MNKCNIIAAPPILEFPELDYALFREDEELVLADKPPSYFKSIKNDKPFSEKTSSILLILNFRYEDFSISQIIVCFCYAFYHRQTLLIKANLSHSLRPVL